MSRGAASRSRTDQAPGTGRRTSPEAAAEKRAKMQHMNEPMLQFFEYAHLPENLQTVSKPFCDLAAAIVATLPRNPERTVALRKLLESKDCAVRAMLFKAAESG